MESLNLMFERGKLARGEDKKVTLEHVASSIFKFELIAV